MSMLVGLIDFLLKPIKGCIWLIVILILAIVFACMILGVFATSQVSAIAPGYDVMLVVDQSPSLWDKDGVGSDPDMLRLSAVNLFLTYLGADDQQAMHRVGVIYFGGNADLIVPLTTLNQKTRQDIQAVIADPTPIPWTDPLEALLLAETELVKAKAPDRHGAIVLLTDGEPVIPDDSPGGMEAYKSHIDEAVQSLHEQGISLYVILLENPSADNDSISSIWAPFWKEMTSKTPRGAFFLALEAQDLMNIYHEIVVGVAGRQAGPQIATRRVSHRETISFTVPEGLSSMTITAWKSDPDMNVLFYRPDGQRVGLTDQDLHYVGSPGLSHEDVWRFQEPVPGVWESEIVGEGLLTLWMDITKASPTPTPTPTPTVTPTISPTATRTPMSTATPRPTMDAKDVLVPLVVAQPTITPSPTPTRSIYSSEGNSYLPITDPITKGVIITMGIFLVVFSGALLKTKVAFQSAGVPLEGKLIVLEAPEDADLPHIIDLSSGSKVEIALGGDSRGSDIYLSGWNGRMILSAFEKDGEVYVLLVTEKGKVIVNTYPTQQKVLKDGDEIELDGYRFRFSHLASARRAWRQRRRPMAVNAHRRTTGRHL